VVSKSTVHVSALGSKHGLGRRDVKT